MDSVTNTYLIRVEQKMLNKYETYDQIYSIIWEIIYNQLHSTLKVHNVYVFDIKKKFWLSLYCTQSLNIVKL